MTSYADAFSALTPNDLINVISALSNKKVGRAATKPEAVARAVRALGIEPELAMGNLSALLRSRNYGATADKVEQVLAAQAEPEIPAEIKQQAAEEFATNGTLNYSADGEPQVDEPDEPESNPNQENEMRKTKVSKPEPVVEPPVVIEYREAAESLSVAKEALRQAQARFQAAAKAYRTANGSAVKAPKTNGGAPTRDQRLLALLERPEGLGQAEIVKTFGRQYSAAYQTKRLAAKYGRKMSVEGEGKGRVFRLPAA